METSENKLTFTVEEAHAGMRADKFLGSVCDDLSRSRLQKLIVDHQVSMNGEVLGTASIKVKMGDYFDVCVPPPQVAEPQAEDISLDIVYEDEHLIVLNKPVGMVVHPGAGNWTGTLVNALLHHCGDSLSGIGGVIRPGIVHRLDKDTAGLMMVAKNDAAHQSLSQQLAERTLHRIYHALTFGVPVPLKGVIDRPVGRHRHNRLKMSVMSNTPKEACTYYKVLESFRDACALVECKLETGRTHQIRVHLEAIGHALIGDPLYDTQPTALISKLKKADYPNDLIKELVEFPHQMLYAHQIVFEHPESGKEMKFTCDPPENISNILKKLK